MSASKHELCAVVSDHLFDYVHDELDAEPGHAVALHLAECADCALASCRLRAELADLSWAQDEMPPPRVQARLRASVEASFGPPWYQRLFAVAMRPLPAYGLVLAGALPVALWFALAGRGDASTAEGAAPNPGASTESSGPRAPQLDGYDASRALGASMVIF